MSSTFASYTTQLASWLEWFHGFYHHWLNSSWSLPAGRPSSRPQEEALREAAEKCRGYLHKYPTSGHQQRHQRSARVGIPWIRVSHWYPIEVSHVPLVSGASHALMLLFVTWETQRQCRQHLEKELDGEALLCAAVKTQGERRAVDCG